MCAYLLDRPTCFNEWAILLLCLFVWFHSFVRSKDRSFFSRYNFIKKLAFMFYGWNHPIESLVVVRTLTFFPFFYAISSDDGVVLVANTRSIIWNCFGPKRSKWIFWAQIKSNGKHWHPTWWSGTNRLRIELCQDSVKCSYELRCVHKYLCFFVRLVESVYGVLFPKHHRRNG